MGMGLREDINPSAENIASELFYVIRQLFADERSGVQIVRLRLYETPNCWVDVEGADYIGTDEFINEVRAWRQDKGEFNYDIREVCQ